MAIRCVIRNRYLAFISDRWCTDGQTDRGPDGRTDGRTDRQTDGRTDGRTNSRTLFPLFAYRRSAPRTMGWSPPPVPQHQLVIFVSTLITGKSFRSPFSTQDDRLTLCRPRPSCPHQRRDAMHEPSGACSGGCGVTLRKKMDKDNKKGTTTPSIEQPRCANR